MATTTLAPAACWPSAQIAQLRGGGGINTALDFAVAAPVLLIWLTHHSGGAYGSLASTRWPSP
jgi:hypothetical protein